MPNELNAFAKGKTSMLMIYFVQSGDELWNVAKKYVTTSEKIRSANNLGDSDIIKPGMKLLIPKI